MHRLFAALSLIGCTLAGCTGPAAAPQGSESAGPVASPEAASPVGGESLVIIHSGEVQAELEPCG